MALTKGVIIGLLAVQIIIAVTFFAVVATNSKNACENRKVTRVAIHRILDMDDSPENINERQAIRRIAPIPEC